MNSRRSEILEGNLAKVILVLSTPLLLGNLLNIFYSLTDAYFIGKLGGVQVAAFVFVIPLLDTVLSFGQGLSMAGTSILAISIGKGEKSEISENVEQFFNFTLYFSLVVGIFGAIFTKEILEIAGTDGELLEEASKYMRILFYATPLTFINLTYTAIRKAEGLNIKATVLLAISVTINVILTPILMFKFDMGIAGAAWGTLLAKVFAAGYSLYDLSQNKNAIRYKLKFSKLKLVKVKEFIKLAIPSAVSNSSQSLGNVILNSYVKSYGIAILAAYGIGNKVNSLFFTISNATQSATAVAVGQNYGAKNYKRVLKTVKTSLIIVVSLSLIGVFVLQNYAREIAQNFTTDEIVLENSVSFIKIVSWTVVTWGIFQIFSGFFNGVKQNHKTMFISIFRLWGIRIPLLLILNKYFDLKEYAVWYCMFYSNILTAIFGGIMYKTSSIYKEIKKEIE